MSDIHNDIRKACNLIRDIDRLLICYRVEKRPSESLLNSLEKSRAAWREVLHKYGDVER